MSTIVAVAALGVIAAFFSLGVSAVSQSVRKLVRRMRGVS